MRFFARALWAPILLAALVLAACGRPVQPSVVPRSAPSGIASAQVFVEPDDGVQPVVEFVRGAQQSLDVAMYLLSDRQVIDALEASRRRGVRVRVMLEENPYGSGPGNRAVFDRLRTTTIATRWSPSGFQLSHDKYAVADHKVALVGTANWTHSAFTDNREFLIEDSDPRDVDQLATLFDADWGHQSFSVNDEHLVISPTNSRTDFLALIGSARKTLHVEAEEIQDAQVESALIEAASRGVEVEVLIPGSTSGPDRNAAGAERLTAGHVQVRRLRNPYVHAKAIVVDGEEAFIGSENVSTSSLDQNREVGLLVSDAAVVRRVEETFSRDWKAGGP